MSLQLHDDFWMRQIVFINSGNAANVALPLSQTGALFGRNNIGKTSAVSALKLFILPETNFKACETKFAFQSNGQFHKTDESFTYYFPSERSFIICEAENPRGPFCIILHRSREEWGYGRILVPTDYESIKHLFWDFDEQYNGGLGRNLPDLDLQTVKRGLKAFKPHYMTSSREIREAIYSRPAAVDDLSRFCLIPLTGKGEVREVEALRALLNLAFDIKGGSDTTLPKAVACIIESENAGNDGSLTVDIGGITQEYQLLKQESEALARVHQNQETWDDLKRSYQQYVTARQSFRTQHNQIAAEALAADEHAASLIDELDEVWEGHRNELHDASNALSQAKANKMSQEERLKDKSKDLQDAESKLHKIDEAWQCYKPIDGIETLQDVVPYLKDQIPDIEAEIKAYESDAEAEQLLAQHNDKRRHLDADIESLKSQLARSEENPLEALDPHGRSVLHSINPVFGRTQYVISEGDKARINGFTDLFELEEGKMRFLGQPINIRAVPFDPEAQRQFLSDELDKTLEQRRDIMERIRRISDRKARPDKLAETRQDLQDTQELITLIPGYDYLLGEKAKLQSETETLQDAKIPESEAILEKVQSDLELARANAKSVQTQLEDAKLQRKDVDAHFRNLKTGLASVREGFSDTVFEQIDQMAGDIRPLESFDLSTLSERVDELASLASTVKSLKAAITRSLHVLVSDNLIQGRASLMYDTEVTFDEVYQQYEDFRAIFENYEDNLKKFQEDIEHHNNETGVRSAAVEAISVAIRSFESAVNRELSKCQISNLSEVRLVVDLDNRFESLRKDLARTTFSGDQLLSDSVYQRLNAFCDEFFTNTGSNGRRVQIDKVITNIRYQYIINGVKKTAQQSHGTTGMISSVLLALLMKRMVPNSAILHFPIVFDEVLSLDSQNIRTIKRVVEENHFILFVACPENSGNVAEVIPRWYDLSLHVLSEGDMIEGCNVLYSDLVESLTDEAAEAPVETVE